MSRVNILFLCHDKGLKFGSYICHEVKQNMQLCVVLKLKIDYSMLSGNPNCVDWGLKTYWTLGIIYYKLQCIPSGI